MRVVSYEQRVACMSAPGDEDRQLRLAKAYVMRLRRRMRATYSLDGKRELADAIKEAESVLRRLRMNIFELQDMLESRAG